MDNNDGRTMAEVILEMELTKEICELRKQKRALEVCNDIIAEKEIIIESINEALEFLKSNR